MVEERVDEAEEDHHATREEQPVLKLVLERVKVRVDAAVVGRETADDDEGEAPARRGVEMRTLR